MTADMTIPSCIRLMPGFCADPGPDGVWEIQVPNGYLGEFDSEAKARAFAALAAALPAVQEDAIARILYEERPYREANGTSVDTWSWDRAVAWEAERSSEDPLLGSAMTGTPRALARKIAAALAPVSPPRDGDDGLAELIEAAKAEFKLWATGIDTKRSAGARYYVFRWDGRAGDEISTHASQAEADAALERQQIEAIIRLALASAPARQGDAAGQPVTLTYTNWRGETAERTITPTGRVVFSSNEWHPEPQWLVEAHDARSGDVRLFALTGFGHPVSNPYTLGATGQGVSGPGAVREAFAKIAECSFDDRPRSRFGSPSHMDWEDGYRDGTQAAAAAIRTAPIPAATPSGPAAIAVEEVERLVKALRTVFYRMGCVHPQTYAGFREAFKKAESDLLDAIRSLASPQDHGAVQDALADPADAYDAGYHEGEAHGRKEARAEIERLTELADKFKWQVIDTCKRAEKAEASVASLVDGALKTNTNPDKPGREGV